MSQFHNRRHAGKISAMPKHPATKQAIRQQIIAARNLRSNTDRNSFSQHLLEAIDISKPKLVASYHPLNSEPSTLEINALLKSENRLVLPKIKSQNLVWMRPVGMQPGPLGIMQPVGPEVSQDQIDLFICPALAIDKTGVRLGRGGGFYDRVLADSKTQRYAVVFSNEVLDCLPTAMHDAKMHGVITELGFLDMQA